MAKKLLPLIALTLPLVLLLPAQRLRAQTETSTTPEEAEEVSPEIDWAAATRPGPHHRHLELTAGDWDFVMRIWSSPGGQPLEVTGSAQGRWTLGGRFLDTLFRADLAGTPFEARAIDGYDNLAEKYVRLWQDNMSTYTMVFEGVCDQPADGPEDAEAAETPAPPAPDGEQIEGGEPEPILVRTLNSPFLDPISGARLRSSLVVSVMDEDHYRVDSTIFSGKLSFKNMEMELSRHAE